jgi:hypothetical protein
MLVSIYETPDPVEADVIVSFLLDNEVRAIVFRSGMEGYYGGGSMFLHPHRIMIDESDLERAKRLLEEVDTGAFDLPDEG